MINLGIFVNDLELVKKFCFKLFELCIATYCNEYKSLRKITNSLIENEYSRDIGISYLILNKLIKKELNYNDYDLIVYLLNSFGNNSDELPSLKISNSILMLRLMEAFETYIHNRITFYEQLIIPFIMVSKNILSENSLSSKDKIMLGRKMFSIRQIIKNELLKNDSEFKRLFSLSEIYQFLSNFFTNHLNNSDIWSIEFSYSLICLEGFCEKNIPKLNDFMNIYDKIYSFIKRTLKVILNKDSIPELILAHDIIMRSESLFQKFDQNKIIKYKKMLIDLRQEIYIKCDEYLRFILKSVYGNIMWNSKIILNKNFLDYFSKYLKKMGYSEQIRNVGLFFSSSEGPSISYFLYRCCEFSKKKGINIRFYTVPGITLNRGLIDKSNQVDFIENRFSINPSCRVKMNNGIVENTNVYKLLSSNDWNIVLGGSSSDSGPFLEQLFNDSYDYDYLPPGKMYKHIIEFNWAMSRGLRSVIFGFSRYHTFQGFYRFIDSFFENF